MSKSARYLILDAYPDPKNEGLKQFLGATIGCWIRTDLCNSDETALAFAKEKLQGFWIVACEIEQQIVSEKSYRNDKSGGGEFFRQSLIDGFVANIHRFIRETICIEDGDLDSSFKEQVDLSNLASRLIAKGCFSLYSRSDRQWANGVTPEGADFIPLWVGSRPSSRWVEFWPSYEPYPVTASELVGILQSFHLVDHWVGVAVSPSSLVTLHPLALRDALVAV